MRLALRGKHGRHVYDHEWWLCQLVAGWLRLSDSEECRDRGSQRLCILWLSEWTKLGCLGGFPKSSIRDRRKLQLYRSGDHERLLLAALSLILAQADPGVAAS